MKVTLYLHDGRIYEETLEDFDLVAFIEDINKDQHKMIQFGGIGVAKNIVKMIDTNQGTITIPE